MFAIEVNFLTGRYVATSHYDRRLPEWPPHPARLFSAMTAEWAVSRDSAEREAFSAEREALEWLEAQPPPSIAASDENPRKVVSHYVPVNDIAIVSQSAYRNKLGRIEKLNESYWAEINASDGEITAKVEKIQDKINKELDVSNLTDKSGQTNYEEALKMLPDGREKQERFFPSVKPEKPRVTFIWDAMPQSELVVVIDNLIERVTRLGHSSSLVSCRVIKEPPSPTLVPARSGVSLRGVTEGQLEALTRKFEAHQGNKPRTLPFIPVRYKEIREPTPDILQSNTAGDWQVFAFNLNSRSVPSTRTVAVTKVFRAAIFHHAQNPLPEGLTGHRQDGAPSLLPHVGFYALPWVGHEHSDGRIMGLALNIPNSLDENTVNTLYKSINSWEQGQGPSDLQLNFGKRGTLSMQRLVSTSELITLRRSRWSRPSRRWATATPIALPTHPGKLSRGKTETRSKAWQKAEEAVARSCQHVGLPEPSHVAVSFSPFIHGARPAPDYPAFSQTGTKGNEVCRKLLHATIIFDNPVSGPLVLGAGRFLGLGLLLPLSEQTQSRKSQQIHDSEKKNSGEKK